VEKTINSYIGRDQMTIRWNKLNIAVLFKI